LLGFHARTKFIIRSTAFIFNRGCFGYR